ncbi:helix-turn-helix domain-containing protein [Nocardiopsis sp. CNT312]|uniref:RNA-guided endonuclease InsQ/TnpB family protein n=1 Tax=Nocardiopsis sp. CNT312 TaxID=1137268 RepID=UPI0004ADEFAC|nr:helix-turn-helix domain-containing protein [Nocardiopsis sp. CNT312]
MLAGRKYRLSPTAEQAERAQGLGDLCRLACGTALEQRREYRRRGAGMNYVRRAAELADAKREHAWLRTAPSHVLQQDLKDLDKACRTHGTFEVRWRSGARWNPSFRFPAANLITTERPNRRWGRAKLPKLGWVAFRRSRRPCGEIRSATVSRKAGHRYVSLLVEDRAPVSEHHAGTPVGVDGGAGVAATTSTGDFRDRECVTSGEKARYRCLQRSPARSEKGSANRRGILAAMSRILGGVTDRRADSTAWTRRTARAERSSCARPAATGTTPMRTRRRTSSAPQGMRCQPVETSPLGGR